MSESTTGSETPTAPGPVNPRRSFFKEALAVVVGGVMSLFPVAVGAWAFLSPLRKQGVKLPGDPDPRPAKVPEDYFQVATVDGLPADGTPQFVKVIADRMDAWTYFPQQPIGSVFLRKEQGGGVVAYNSTCPHAGCAVDFRAGDRNFYCPCHNSSFTLEGQRSADSPSARNLDELEVKVVDGDVWVRYVDFRTGKGEREELS